MQSGKRCLEIPEIRHDGGLVLHLAAELPRVLLELLQGLAHVVVVHRSHEGAVRLLDGDLQKHGERVSICGCNYNALPLVLSKLVQTKLVEPK